MKKQTSNTARAELARHIAAVIAHPETPVGLYNAMVDELRTWARFDWETVAEVDRILLNAANDAGGGAARKR
jgi:hypothetical protein